MLIIPKKHTAPSDDTTAQDEELLGYILGKVKEIAAELGLEKRVSTRKQRLVKTVWQTVKTSAFPSSGKKKDDVASRRTGKKNRCIKCHKIV